MICPPNTRRDDPLLDSLVLAIIILVGIYPTVMAALMVRRRRLVWSRDRTHAIEGRAAVITGRVVLGLIAAVDLLLIYSIGCALYWY